MFIKVNFETIVNDYNKMIWCALPNPSNPLSTRCIDELTIINEVLEFEYKNMNWYQISGTCIYGIADYDFNTTLDYLNSFLRESGQTKAIEIFNLNNNLIYKDVNIPYIPSKTEEVV